MARERFEDFVGLVEGLHKEVVRIKAREAERLGFRGADVMCLYRLARHPEGLAASELARCCDVSRAAMSRTVARLSEGGLVEVGGPDSSRYRAAVRLTPAGEAAVAPMGRIVSAVLDRTGEALGRERREQMYESMALVLETLRGIDADEKGDAPASADAAAAPAAAPAPAAASLSPDADEPAAGQTR